jgi:hypothetical protein
MIQLLVGPEPVGIAASAHGEPASWWDGRGHRGLRLAAGLVDLFELNVVPILLGGGERLLELVGNLKLEQVRVIEAPGVSHLKYRVVK